MPNIDTASFYAPMNNSIARARRLAEERGMADANYGDQARAEELRLMQQAREMAGRNELEGNRRFDSKVSLFRQLFGGGEPGGHDTAQPVNALTQFSGRGMRPQMPANFDDGMQRGRINNALSRYLMQGF